MQFLNPSCTALLAAQEAPGSSKFTPKISNLEMCKYCLKKLLELNSVVASSRSNSVVQTTLSIEDWIQTRGGIITV